MNPFDRTIAALFLYQRNQKMMNNRYSYRWIFNFLGMDVMRKVRKGNIYEIS